VVPSSCVLNIYEEDGTQLLINETITPGSDGTCTYTVESDITDELSEHNQARWTVVISGKTYVYTTMFDVVLSIIRNELLDQDLFDECSALEKFNYCRSGTVDSGGTTYMIDNELMNHAENIYKGGLLEFVDGTNENNSRIVTAYDSSDGKLTWATALSAIVDTTTKYVLKKTFQRQINVAWDELLNYIDNQGFRPALICNSERLKTPHKYFTLAKICYGLMKDVNDSWMVLAEKYEEKGYSLLAGLKFREMTDDENETANTESFVSHSFRR
jgi:hypothetical protein